MKLKRYIFIFLTSAMLLGSCERKSTTLDEYIAFIPALKDDAWGESKVGGTRTSDTKTATKSNQIGGTPSTVGVMAFNSGSNDFDMAIHKPNMLHNTLLTKNISTGGWQYDIMAIWPGADNKSSFFAYSPYSSDLNGITVSDSDLAGVPIVTYNMPVLAENQSRLMLSGSRTNIIQTVPVYLILSHAVAAVGFNLRGAGERVTKIAVRGIVDGGRVPMVSPAVWTLDAVPSTPPERPLYEVGIKKDAGTTAGTFEDYITATGTNTNIMKDNGYLMLIPQTHTLGAEIVISVNGVELVFPLTVQGQTLGWAAGKIYMYGIDLSSDAPSSTIDATITLDVKPWVFDNTSNPEVII